MRREPSFRVLRRAVAVRVRRMIVMALLSVAALFDLSCRSGGMRKADQAMLEAMRTVPPCWSPYLQAEQAELTPDMIRKGALVIPSKYAGYGLVVYDRDADRWQSCHLPKGVVMLVNHPHVWWVGGEGENHCWNVDTGQRADFPALPAELFVAPPALLDTGSRPLAAASAGRIWSWIEAAKRYQMFLPMEKRWVDLPESDSLPPHMAVLSAEETDAKIRLRLGPQIFDFRDMRGSSGRGFAFDKPRREWSEDTRRRSRWYAWLPAAAGFWVLTHNGQGRWVPDDKAADVSFEPGLWYGIRPAGGKLWGLAKAAVPDKYCIIEVTGVDPRTRRPVPELQPTAAIRDNLVYDGTHLWSWPSPPLGPVVRHTPGDWRTKEYRTVEGLQQRVLAFEASPRFFSFPANRARYDRVRRRWLDFDRVPWHGAPRPDPCLIDHCVGDDSHLFFIVSDGLPAEHWNTSVGIGCYDVQRDEVTLYTAEEVAAGRWPWGEPVTWRKPYYNAPPKAMAGAGVRAAWDALCRAHPEWARPRVPDASAGFRTDGLTVNVWAKDAEWLWGAIWDAKAPSRTSGSGGALFVVARRRTGAPWIRVPYLDGDGFWIDGDYVYASIQGRFHRALKAEFLKTLALEDGPQPESTAGGERR